MLPTPFLVAWGQREQENFHLIEEAVKNSTFNRFRVGLFLLYTVANRQNAREVVAAVHESQKSLMVSQQASIIQMDYIAHFKAIVFRTPTDQFMHFGHLLPETEHDHIIDNLTQFMRFAVPTGKDDYLALLSCAAELARLGLFPTT